MRLLIFFTFLILSFSLNAQKNDLLILDGVKYKGKLINYSKSDIRNSESGKISFFIYRLNDTLNISSDRNIKLKINRYSEFYEFTKKSWNNIELGINTGNLAQILAHLFQKVYSIINTLISDLVQVFL